MLKCSLLVITLIALTSCDRSSKPAISVTRPDQEVIDRHNIKRTEKGVRKIGDNWILYRSRIVGWKPEKRFEEWKTPGNTDLSKTVQYNGEDPVWEEDIYYTGRSYKPSDPDVAVDNERFIIHYDYVSDKISLKYAGADRAVRNQIGETNISRRNELEGFSNKEKLKLAQEILDSLGIKEND